jgi:hypothetical protein
MSSQPSSVRVREFFFLFWGVCVFLHFETLSIDRIKDKRGERERKKEKRKEEKHFPRVRFVIMSADMGREKKMKNNFKRKEKRKEKRNSSRLYVGRACHDSLRSPAVILTMRSLLLFTSKLPVTRLYSRRLGLLVCRIREFSNAFGRSPESHTNPVLLLQRHRQLKINGQLYKCM